MVDEIIFGNDVECTCEWHTSSVSEQSSIGLAIAK